MSNRCIRRPVFRISTRSAFAAAWVLALTAISAGAFERTEVREDCRNHDKLRQPFFGETHLHTGLSFDASFRFVPTRPRDAYRFAKGGSVDGVGPNGFEIRTYKPDRPLDFAAVTDHSEQFGEMGICKSMDDKPAGYFSYECQLLRGFWWQPGYFPGALQSNFASSFFNLVALPNNGPSSLNTRMPMCVNGEADCNKGEEDVWKEMQMAAEEAYDRSSKCTFTSFIGYEMTSTPAGVNWHRNVIFRNDRVVPRPITAIDLGQMPNPDPKTVPPKQILKGGPDIKKLWKGLREQCLDKGNGCDVLTIPHNSNLGGGFSIGQPPDEIIPPMFFTPENPADAQQRQLFEPLVEIYQDKGSSECRWDPRFVAKNGPPGVDTTDENCDFELLDNSGVLGAAGATGGGRSATPPSGFNERMYVRNVLKDGLLIETKLGVNPFKLGIIAATDSHNGNPGFTVEDERFRGHLGIEDAIPVQSASNIQNSSGGISVAWAEENSRDSIFEALKRKETYGTSGTRPIVRFFGGWDFEASDCNSKFVEKGYERGVPMGGDLKLSDQSNNQSPTFIASALWDDYVGTPLQQVQIIKGWVENGHTKEMVYTVAGKSNSRATVDNQCKRTGVDEGEESLCAVWKDPDFDPEQPAFYYVRVLEDPVCRYSTLICQKNYNINPLEPEKCKAQLDVVRSVSPTKYAEAALCCNNETSNPTIVQPIIQERAWTSPIWYTPPAH